MQQFMVLSGAVWQHSGTEEYLQTVQTAHFLEGRTLFCTVCTRWRGNILAQTALAPNQTSIEPVCAFRGIALTHYVCD